MKTAVYDVNQLAMVAVEYVPARTDHWGRSLKSSTVSIWWAENHGIKLTPADARVLARALEQYADICDREQKK